MDSKSSHVSPPRRCDGAHRSCAPATWSRRCGLGMRPSPAGVHPPGLDMGSDPMPLPSPVQRRIRCNSAPIGTSPLKHC